MVSETIQLRGHIIDSLTLPKVLDEILTRGANFTMLEVKIGQRRADQSFARIEVSAPTNEALDDLVLRLRQHGAEVEDKGDAQLALAPADGIFPPNFFVTTNRQTFVRIDGKEYEVQPPIMDSGIAFNRANKEARTVKFAGARTKTRRSAALTGASIPVRITFCCAVRWSVSRNCSTIERSAVRKRTSPASPMRPFSTYRP